MPLFPLHLTRSVAPLAVLVCGSVLHAASIEAPGINFSNPPAIISLELPHVPQSGLRTNLGTLGSIGGFAGGASVPALPGVPSAPAASNTPASTGGSNPTTSTGGGTPGSPSGGTTPTTSNLPQVAAQNGPSPTPGVPDGGEGAALLGVALLGLAFARRATLARH